MANGGSLGGKTLISGKTFSEFHSNPTVESEIPWGQRTNFTQGGVCSFDWNSAKSIEMNPNARVDELSDSVEDSLYAHREGWYGWMGFGGPVMQWHPELKIGFGYTTTTLLPIDFFNKRISFL